MEQTHIRAFFNNIGRSVDDFLADDFAEQYLESIKLSLDEFFPGANPSEIIEELLPLRGGDWDGDIKQTLVFLARMDLPLVLSRLRPLADDPKDGQFYLEALAEIGLYWGDMEIGDRERISQEYLSPILDRLETLTEAELDWLDACLRYFSSESSLRGLYRIKQSLPIEGSNLEKELAESIEWNLKVLKSPGKGTN